MIELTVIQAFVDDFLNYYECLIIYRLLTKKKITVKLAIADLFIILLITLIPTTLGVINIVLLILYLWIYDRIIHSAYIINDNIIALLTIMAMQIAFNLIDHYTFILIKRFNMLTLTGWLIPLSDLLLSILLILFIIKSQNFRQKLQLITLQSNENFQIWKIVFVFFFTYLTVDTLIESEQIANHYAVLFLLLYLSILITCYQSLNSLFITHLQNKRQREQIDDYKIKLNHAKHMNLYFKKIRRERHNAKNILLNIQGYINDGNLQRANELLANFLNTDLNHKSYKLVDNELSKIRIPGLYNLIKEKAYSIMENHIPLSIEINDEIKELPGSEISTSQIIGNLIDNAFEASKQKKKSYIQIAILKHNNQSYEFSVSNLLGKRFNINEAMQWGNSNKKNHQGIGLSSIKEIVDDDEHYSFVAEIKNNTITMTCFIQEKND